MIDNISKETSISIILVGICIFVAGIVLFYDSAIIIGGNLIILVGYFSLFKMNPRYFLLKEKFYGSVLFLGGIIILIFKYMAFGIFLELCGFFLLFKSSLPSLTQLFTNLITKRPVFKLN